MRRETGNEQSVRVRYDEGVAIHIDLEPCAVACEGGSEASAEEHIGQPLNPQRFISRVPPQENLRAANPAIDKGFSGTERTKP